MKRIIFRINKYIIVLCFALCLLMMAQSAFALPFRSDLNRGNDLYKKGKYAEAGQVYNKILQKKAGDLKARFNLGDSLYKEGRYQESQKVFESLTAPSVPKGLRESAYYNLGNSFFKQEDYKGAIGAYEEALKIDPKDKDAQFNLELAKKMLTMPKHNKQDQQKDKEKDKQQKKEDEKNKSGDKSEDKNKDKRNDQNEQAPTKPGQMSKEDALRILNALDDQEKHKTQRMKAGRGKGNVRDW
ncbi:MAG TPA: tetratricopeptide repeat protein [Smithella sp.]|nr:tetratricopeptide repeat protein [Smithella sp.]MDM7987932.1 tetratricopeptide repeat protein [Smithella sp.]HNY50617.1 tetratricopeptide repeat protein [Smithella sp.]HOG89184.1 tetratricopeptide repeat protein [Smithella sp.]HOU49935.1 tetratricopeptide repeat protein [Smithella sp.]